METHSIFSSSLKSERKQVLKILIPSAILILIGVWTLLPIFWGSTYRLDSYFYRLVIDIYDLDAAPGAILGSTITKSLTDSMKETPHFTFRIMNATGMTFTDFENGVVNEHSWASVVINANATSSLNAALAGTGPYNQNSISVYVASARFYQVVLEYILPFIGQLLTKPILAASHIAISQFLTSATPATLSALTSDQLSAISQPYNFINIDVRPILSTQWSGAAPLEAGLIYYIIFAFHVTIFLYNGRESFNKAIKEKDILLSSINVILLRFIPIGIAYFFLSLWYSLINVAFSVPMNGNGHSGLNSQAGFMVFWMLNLLTLSALGTAMESIITLLTIRFFPLFLITWIILNITSSFFPPILMENFYRYGYAMPFWHSTTADKFIFWGARNRLGLNFGVLIAWTVLSMCTMLIFEFGQRRRTIRSIKKEREKEREKSVAEA